MAARKKTTVKKKETKPSGTCGQCKHCTYRTDFHTLSLKGTPTLGFCPYWTQSRSVLLCLDRCDKFEPKENTK